MISHRAPCGFKCLINNFYYFGYKICGVRHFSEDVNQLSGFVRHIPVSPVDQKELIRRTPEKILGSRLLKVAILGEPNAGKSTLVNEIVGRKTCSVSKKVHTTRKMLKTVFVDNKTQIVFLDTPGLVSNQELKQHDLEESFRLDPEKALKQADLLVVLHDVSNRWNRKSLGLKVLNLLKLYPGKPSILVLNKVDLLKEKRLLLEVSQTLTEGMVGGKLVSAIKAPPKVLIPKKDISMADLVSKKSNGEQTGIVTENEVHAASKRQAGWPNFSHVFMISALNRDGVEQFLGHLIESAKPAHWVYNSSVVTDQNPMEMATNTVREKLLDLLPKEIPYKTKVSINYWDVNEAGLLNANFTVDCTKASSARIVIGKGGQTVKEIARQVEQDLRNIFHCDVRVRLLVQPDISNQLP